MPLLLYEYNIFFYTHIVNMALVLQEREEDWDNHKLTGDPFFKFYIMTYVMHVGSFENQAQIGAKVS